MLKMLGACETPLPHDKSNVHYGWPQKRHDALYTTELPLKLYSNELP